MSQPTVVVFIRCLSVCLSACPSVCLSACLSVCLFVSLSSYHFPFLSPSLSPSFPLYSPSPFFLLLLVHGTDDTIIPTRASQFIYDLAQQPKELRFYEGAGHGLTECREELDELLFTWLKSKLASPGQPS